MMSSSPAPFEQSTGTVRLRKRTDARAARAFGRFEALVGHGRRVGEVLAHQDAETMRGHHIYRAYDTVVHYRPAFHGTKEVWR